MPWPRKIIETTERDPLMNNSGHLPVLLEETIAMLQPKSVGCYFDGTVGGGGHASAVLQRILPLGRLFACDRDAETLKKTSACLTTKFGGNFVCAHGNYSEVNRLFPGITFDGVLLDLGCSSMQLDQGERGFSFQCSAPLDMRMDRSQVLTAADVINTYSEEELADIFYYYGGEKRSRRMAHLIVSKRNSTPFVDTLQLANFIERFFPRMGQKIHPATKVFQGLRIEVNQEFEHLKTALEEIVKLLNKGARLCVISFHSGEDKIVKDFGREYARDYIVNGNVDIPEYRIPRAPILKIVTKKSIEASEEEKGKNPRSRSARLRVYEKL